MELSFEQGVTNLTVPMQTFLHITLIFSARACDGRRNQDFPKGRS